MSALITIQNVAHPSPCTQGTKLMLCELSLPFFFKLNAIEQRPKHTIDIVIWNRGCFHSPLGLWWHSWGLVVPSWSVRWPPTRPCLLVTLQQAGGTQETRSTETYKVNICYTSYNIYMLERMISAVYKRRALSLREKKNAKTDWWRNACFDRKQAQLERHPTHNFKTVPQQKNVVYEVLHKKIYNIAISATSTGARAAENTQARNFGAEEPVSWLNQYSLPRIHSMCTATYRVVQTPVRSRLRMERNSSFYCSNIKIYIY